MIRVKFDKKLYTLEAIKQAAQVYQDWADFDIKENKEEIEVDINSEEENERVIRDEFGNYVLALMKNL